MRFARPWTAIVAIVTAAALVTSVGCSVSTNEEPQAAGELFTQFVQSTTTSSSTSTPENAPRSVEVYFVQTTDGSSIVKPVSRNFGVDATFEDILGNLFTFPPNEEVPAERGLTSQIHDSANLISAQLASPDSTELVVDTTLFDTVDGSELRIALAQIVLTATASQRIESVTFVNEGEPESPIVAGGETVSRPVTANDYRTLLRP